MAPIRRYLRITKYSVLEVRIYLDKPSDTSWLLSLRDPVLPRIIAAIRPIVLPKLREENENARRKGGKKRRGIKDTVEMEECGVDIFLTEVSTRHSLLTKGKEVRDGRGKGGVLEGWLRRDREGVGVVEEEEGEDDDVVELKDVPEVGEGRVSGGGKEDDAVFVSSSDEETFQTQKARGTKRKRKSRAPEPAAEEITEDKKKLAVSTSYDGFSIYGRILCLVVKRKGRKAAQENAGGGSDMMERWVSTQAAQEPGLDEDENR